MLEHLNSLACLLMLLGLFPVASLASPREHPGHVILILLVGMAFALQVIGPYVDWLPPTVWQTSLLHILQATVVLIWRQRLWLFIRSELVEPPLKHPLRRLSDIETLGMTDLNQVHGKGP